MQTIFFQLQSARNLKPYSEAKFAWRLNRKQGIVTALMYQVKCSDFALERGFSFMQLSAIDNIGNRDGQQLPKAKEIS